MRTSRMMLACVVGALVLAGGCAKSGCGNCGEGRECGSTAHCKSFKGTATTVNKMCVVMTEDPVDPAVKPVTWRGTEYGLCCNGCRPKWDAMSDAQRDAAVARVVSVTH